MSEWIRCDERLPEKEGVYLLTLLNREWNRDRSGIEDGLKPPHDEYWEKHKGLYGQLPDGQWVKVEQRVFHDGIWSGYMETVLAWMQMPRPYGVEEQLQLDPTVDAVQVVRCADCKFAELYKGKFFCAKNWNNLTADWYCADGERKNDA